jgi:hypothetical protein
MGDDDDQFLFDTDDEAVEEDLMPERHWIGGDEHFTAPRPPAATPGPGS